MLRPFGFKMNRVELFNKRCAHRRYSIDWLNKHAKFPYRKGRKSRECRNLRHAGRHGSRGYADIVGTLNINTFDNEGADDCKYAFHDEPFEHKMRQTGGIFAKAAEPTEADKRFFIGREGLLGVYAILKNVSEKSFFPTRKSLSGSCRNMPPSSRMKKLYLR